MHSPAACSPRAPPQVQGGGQWPVSKTTLSSCPSFPRTRCTQLTPVLLLPRRTLPRKPMLERSISCNTPGLTLRHIFMSFTPRSSLVLFHCLLILRWGSVLGKHGSFRPDLLHPDFPVVTILSGLFSLGFRESDMHWIDETCSYFALRKCEFSFPLELQIQVKAKRGRQLTFTNIRWEKKEVQRDPPLDQANRLPNDRGASLWSGG